MSKIISNLQAAAQVMFTEDFCAERGLPGAKVLIEKEQIALRVPTKGQTLYSSSWDFESEELDSLVTRIDSVVCELIVQAKAFPDLPEDVLQRQRDLSAGRPVRVL